MLSSNYAVIHATTRALYAQMLDTSTWSSLIHAPHFDGVITLLSKTVYGTYLELDRKLLTPRRVAYQIKRHLADVYTKLIRLAPKRRQNLLQLLWQFYEVDNLKAVLRGIEAKTPWSRILFLLSPVTKHGYVSTTDMERMVRSGDVHRAIAQLEHTPYYDTLAHAVERYHSEHSLFPLEVALDLDYRRRLWQCIEQLTGDDRDYAMRIIGTTLDVDNLLWAIRYRVYHHLTEAEIINYTLPGHYQVCDSDIRAIATGENFVAVIKRLYPKVAATIPEFNDTENISRARDGVRAFEVALQRHIRQICHKTFIGYPFHIGIPLAYLRLNEYEIRDLIVLIESQASHTPLDTFIPLLEIEVI
jgi:vacuolar-type H+-ATPase subunit C/Vma6